MKALMVLLALWLSACDRSGDQRSEAPPLTPPAAEIAGPAQVSKPPAVVPLPKDQAELDRLILAGYTPHAGHLHPPGVEQCPLAKGAEAVM
jgi:hypothetical protein